ncbi:SMC-Scp complex subunit ScpB [Dactylosporangium sp. CA-139066]|uniref:SMC-Scp complex subunit ScpB n=1 Tax=Dactylosporangium sp. CA-139066 TaxID=3239930 RepID=UPI003D8F5790
MAADEPGTEEQPVAEQATDEPDADLATDEPAAAEEAPDEEAIVTEQPADEPDTDLATDEPEPAAAEEAPDEEATARDVSDDDAPGMAEAADEQPRPEAVPDADDQSAAGGEQVVVQTLPGVGGDTVGNQEPAAENVRPEMTDSELRGAVEAILLVVDEPTSEVTLAQVLEQPVDRVLAALEAASVQYSQLGFGFDLRRVAGGWRLYTRPEYAAYVEKFVLDGQQIRLTQAALETLAVIAYKQPVTRSRISAIRGVNCDGVVRTLVTRGLIEETGSEPESGAFLYRTTTLFLEKLGLDSVDQLPPLAPFLPDDIDEIADAQR